MIFFCLGWDRCGCARISPLYRINKAHLARSSHVHNPHSHTHAHTCVHTRSYDRMVVVWDVASGTATAKFAMPGPVSKVVPPATHSTSKKK